MGKKPEPACEIARTSGGEKKKNEIQYNSNRQSLLSDKQPSE